MESLNIIESQISDLNEKIATANKLIARYNSDNKELADMIKSNNNNLAIYSEYIVKWTKQITDLTKQLKYMVINGIS
jgi:peptidoglycan hydrolase CwlO-like protein